MKFHSTNFLSSLSRKRKYHRCHLSFYAKIKTLIHIQVMDMIFLWKNWQNTPTSPLKRYNMYLRWMVRKDELDLGLLPKFTPKIF